MRNCNLKELPSPVQTITDQRFWANPIMPMLNPHVIKKNHLWSSRLKNPHLS